MTLPDNIGYYPEPLAVTHNQESIVFREIVPRPYAEKDRVAISGFSSYAKDPFSPDDSNLLEDIIGPELKLYLTIHPVITKTSGVLFCRL